jgi:pyridoxal phosphate enzyme (YggS family)
LIFENYQYILEQIKKIRPQNTPKLVAVSKKQPLLKIEEALLSGIRSFGENQVKEGIEKFSGLIETYPDIELHHIGPVQTGTVRKLFGLFAFTHGVGSENALEELVKQANARKSKIKYFLQVNLSLEDTKSGFEKLELLKILKSISRYNSDYALFYGLMTMGPTDGESISTRNVFKELNQIRFDYCPNAKLSMGMSGDYLIAAEEGSDYIRVGSAIFGERLIK